jgi:CMP-N-acetylneuraminic acid synthetase
VLLNKNVENKNFRFLIYLQPTSPLRDLVEIKKNLSLIKKNNYDAIFSVTKISKSFHPLKVFKKNKNNFLKLFIPKGKNIIARQQLKNVYIRNGLFYIFNINRLLKKKTIYLPKIYCYETLRDTINIDTQKDLKFFRQNI